AIDSLVDPHGEAPGADGRDRERWHQDGGDDQEGIDLHAPPMRPVVTRVARCRRPGPFKLHCEPRWLVRTIPPCRASARQSDRFPARIVGDPRSERRLDRGPTPGNYRCFGSPVLTWIKPEPLSAWRMLRRARRRRALSRALGRKREKGCES